MKEKIIQYKGANPLIGIPGYLAILAFAIFVLTIAASLFPESGSDWSGLFQTFFIFAGCIAANAITLSVLDIFKAEPCIIYASKRVVRAIVMIASFAGISLLLIILASLKNPKVSTTVSSACYALSLFGIILLLAQFVIAISLEVTAKAKPERTKLPECFILGHLTGTVACLCLGIYRHATKILSAEIGEPLVLLFTVGAISFLWLENKDAGIADREVIPLSTASVLWVGSALTANYAYETLASVTFILPYLVYFLPLILLNFYYYVSAPEEA